MSGWGVPIHIVRHEHVTVERLLLPTRSYRLHRGALPEAIAVWDRIAPVVDGDTDVFLSRSRLERDARRVTGDEGLDQAFADAGFVVMHPQDHSIVEQIALVARARSLVGVSGSQLHLSMFARSCRTVIEIGDLQRRDRPLIDQVRLAEARGHGFFFVPLVTVGEQRDVRATLDRALTHIG